MANVISMSFKSAETTFTNRLKGSGIAMNGGTTEEREELEKQKLSFSETLRERFEHEKSGVSTVMEGIGSSVLYGNLAHAIVDGIFECNDETGVQMCHYMLKYGTSLLRNYIVIV